MGAKLGEKRELSPKLISMNDLFTKYPNANKISFFNAKLNESNNKKNYRFILQRLFFI